MAESDKTREGRVRRQAARQGLRLIKSRRRNPEAADFGCYGLADIQTNGAVFGFGPVGLDADLDRVEGFLAE